MTLEIFDEFIYGDKSMHKQVRNAFGGKCWDMSSQLYSLKFDLRHLKLT